MKKAILLLLLFVVPLSVYGWSDLTVKYMVVTSFKTFPEGLRLYLDSERVSLLKGVESIDENDFYSVKEVESFVCKQGKRIEQMIKERKKVRDIAFETGRLLKGIAILSFPFSFDHSFYRKDYQAYCEYKLDKFIFAFQKLKKRNFETRNCKSIVKSLYKKSINLKKKILNDYEIYDNSSNFDDLSAAFGSGSLLFSDTCFAMSEIVSKIWESVNGSLEGSLILEGR